MDTDFEKEIIIKKLSNEKIEEKFGIPVFKNISGTVPSKNRYDFGQKCLELYLLMNRWMALNQRGKIILSYFKKNNFYKISIYGMHHVGHRLCDELKGTEIEVVYTMDRNIKVRYEGIENYTSFECLPEVDAVIVTPITFYGEIKSDLETKLKCPIISLLDVIADVERE